MKLLLSAVFLFSSSYCLADELFKFVNVVCLEKAGFFEVSPTMIPNISAYSKNEEIVKYIESHSNLIYGSGVVEKECKLSGGNFKIRILYTKPAGEGRCMGNPGASITLFKNNKTIIDTVSFDWSCDWPDLNKLTVTNGKYVQIYGTNYTFGGTMKNNFFISLIDDNVTINGEYLRVKAEEQFRKIE